VLFLPTPLSAPVYIVRNYSGSLYNDRRRFMDRTRVCSVEQGRKDGSVSIGERARVPPIDLTRAAGGGGGESE